MKKPNMPFALFVVMAFLPQGYEQPVSSGGYTKLEQGENRLRICSAPILCWTTWENKVCTRILYAGKDNKPATPAGEGNSVRHTWIIIAYNYTKKIIEIWEIDKQTIIADLIALCNDSDWGDPTLYDIKVTKIGTTKDNTKYSTIPCPKADVSNEVIEAYTTTPIDLNQMLIKDGNPFIGLKPGATAASQPAATGTKVVTPVNWVPGDPLPFNEKGKPYRIDPASPSGPLLPPLPF